MKLIIKCSIFFALNFVQFLYIDIYSYFFSSSIAAFSFVFNLKNPMSALSISTPGIGVAHLPNQKHKIASSKGANFTLMMCGESGLGKTTFMNTLFATTVKNYKVPEKRYEKQLDRTVEIEITKAEIEENKFKVRLTVIDTPGFGDYVNNRDSWLPIVDFIDEQHENYMRQEQQPFRQGKIDMRVHACLYFIWPNGHSLKALDIEAMKRLGSRVNLIPIIAKADTLTPKDLQAFKENVRECIQKNNINVYRCPVESEDEETTARNQAIIDALPFSIIGSTEIVTTKDGRQVRGREYSWGVAEVENDDHCDFTKLRNLLIRSHMLDLITSTEDYHYEYYRQQQMATRKFGEPKLKKSENPKFREKEEALRKSFTEKVRNEESRFRQWEQQLISERDRLNKDLETQHAHIKALETELDLMYQQVGRNGGSMLRR
ncbi:MAG: Septin-domain-containing protein [Benjaminiella poitrasii]|nr:MAG: Septin-domain-containing protein [Benjaminiella poitrasii]